MLQMLAKIARVMAKFIFLPLGVLILIGAGYTYWSNSNWIAKASKAPGTVEQLAEVKSTDDDTNKVAINYAPVVKFKTADGKEQSFQSSSSSNPAAFKVGDAVTVLYDPAKPADAAIDGIMGVNLLPTLLATIGAIFVGISLLVLFIARLILRRA